MSDVQDKKQGPDVTPAQAAAEQRAGYQFGVDPASRRRDYNPVTPAQADAQRIIARQQMEAAQNQAANGSPVSELPRPTGTLSPLDGLIGQMHRAVDGVKSIASALESHLGNDVDLDGVRDRANSILREVGTEIRSVAGRSGISMNAWAPGTFTAPEHTEGAAAVPNPRNDYANTTGANTGTTPGQATGDLGRLPDMRQVQQDNADRVQRQADRQGQQQQPGQSGAYDPQPPNENPEPPRSAPTEGEAHDPANPLA